MAQTRTTTSHYQIQKVRRADWLKYWADNQRSIVHEADVEMIDTPRRMKRGVMISADGDMPSLNLDANLHSIEPGVESTVHRHSWDAIMYVLNGSGWTEVNGKRYEWRPWDTVYLPAGQWHRHSCTSEGAARYVTFSVQPMVELLGLALLEDGGDTPFEELPSAPTAAGGLDGDDPYSRRVQRLNDKTTALNETRILTPYEDVPFKVTPRGARSGFLVDRTIGHNTGGLTAVIHQLAPGLYQSRHRHGGEAYLYCITGEGYSMVNDKRVDWKKGDLVVVDHWEMHQHHNASETEIAAIIRVHNFDTLYYGMAAMLAPLNMFEEPDKLDGPPDISSVEWPDVAQGRPSA
jgi:gentisate 1,2-dioxygenase